MKIVTVEQMKALEAAAVAAGSSERELMEQAGLAAAQEAWLAAGAVEALTVVVLVGPGNNGGDGLVAARRLVDLGATPHVYLLRPRPDDDPLWRALLEANVSYLAAPDDDGFRGLEAMLAEASCVIDALLGTGVSRPVEGDLAEVLARLRAVRERSPRPQLIALDVPSGIDADGGDADPATVEADITIAFGHPKTGLYAMPGRGYAGQIVSVGVGIPPEASDALPFEEIDLRQSREAMPPRPSDAHKGTFGRATIAAGSRRFPGAARLAAEAAARSGAGLVALAAPEAIQQLLVYGLPDVVHEPLPSTDGALDGDAARALLRALHESAGEALLVGPGLSLTDATQEFVRTLLAGVDAVEGLRAVVLDADALNVLATAPGWHDGLSLPRVLTPHPGEMARLAGNTVAEVQSNRLQTALAYARQTGSIVVLKGACTVVAAPDGRASISPAANAMLATAGTGDVLAGLIAGLIAQGVEPFEASSAAVYMHAQCGDQVATAYGTAAGLAQDLLRALPEARKLLEDNA